MFTRNIITLVLLLSATQFALAHEVWIDQRAGELVVLSGHAGKPEPYDPAGVQTPQAFDSKGKDVAVEIVKGKDGASLSLKEKPAYVAAVYEGGYWMKTTDGWKKMKKSEAQGKFDIVEAIKSGKCCKRFLAASDAYGKPVGQYFEILPQKDPATLRSGDSLPIKVLFQGRPVEGIEVSTGGDHASAKMGSLKTDKEGMATVPIERSGAQMVKASHKVPLKNDPDADVLSLSSTITFDAH